MSEKDFSFLQKDKDIKIETLMNIKNCIAAINKLKDDIAQKEIDIKNFKKLLEIKLRVELPAFFDESGIRELTIDTGESISIANCLHASINKKDIHDVYQKLKDSKVLSEDTLKTMFKKKINIENFTDDHLQKLIDLAFEFDIDISIHHQTLNKLVRTALEQGKSLPDQIQIFAYKEAQIKI